jgi:hypothetical protein
MRRASQPPCQVSRAAAISSADGRLQFVVRRDGSAVYVDRIQPLTGIGRLSHIVRLKDLRSFDLSYETDEMRFQYPLIYWRLRQVVEEALKHDAGCAV